MCDICEELAKNAITTDDDVAILLGNSSAPSVRVVARKHGNLGELPRKTQEHLFTTASTMSSLVFDISAAHGTNMIIDDANHAVVTVCGRFEEDGIDLRWKPQRTTSEQLSETAKSISSETWYIGKDTKPSIAAEEPPSHTEESKRSDTPKDVAAEIQKHVESGPKTEHNYLIKHLTRKR